jgi:hypothetical protein
MFKIFARAELRLHPLGCCIPIAASSSPAALFAFVKLLKLSIKDIWRKPMKQPHTLRMTLVLLALSGLTTICSAQSGTASSKQTAAIATISVAACNVPNSVTPCPGTWVDLVPTLTVKTSNSTSLFVDVSTVVGLYTSTQVKGNNTSATSSATATAGVHVRVLLDNVIYGFPDKLGAGIDFDNRVQTLTANLGNIFTSACAPGSSTTCTLTPEQITLILNTSSAHAFNFVLLNVGSGTHTVEVQVLADTNSSEMTGGVAIAGAAYGPASVTIDEVRLVHDFSF